MSTDERIAAARSRAFQQINLFNRLEQAAVIAVFVGCSEEQFAETARAQWQRAAGRLEEVTAMLMPPPEGKAS